MKAYFLIFALILSYLSSLAQQKIYPIKVTKIEKGFYVHTSFNDYDGKPFPSNGLIVEGKKSVLIVDTPWGAESTQQLIDWIKTNLKKPIVYCIPTHSHDDRVSGINLLHAYGVKVMTSYRSVEKILEKNLDRPDVLLPDDFTFLFEKIRVRTFYPGEGHTSDNIVVWFPQKKILFGGCFVKSYRAFGLGNIADANLKEWENSMKKVIKNFPNPSLVIPGHQEWDKTNSLAHTLQLLEKNNKEQKGN